MHSLPVALEEQLCYCGYRRKKTDFNAIQVQSVQKCIRCNFSRTPDKTNSYVYKDYWMRFHSSTIICTYREISAAFTFTIHGFLPLNHPDIHSRLQLLDSRQSNGVKEYNTKSNRVCAYSIIVVVVDMDHSIQGMYGLLPIAYVILIFKGGAKRISVLRWMRFG